MDAIFWSQTCCPPGCLVQRKNHWSKIYFPILGLIQFRSLQYHPKNINLQKVDYFIGLLLRCQVGSLCYPTDLWAILVGTPLQFPKMTHCVFQHPIHWKFGFKSDQKITHVTSTVHHIFFRVSILIFPRFFPGQGFGRLFWTAAEPSRLKILHHSELLSPEPAGCVRWDKFFGQVALRELVKVVLFNLMVIHPKLY